MGAGCRISGFGCRVSGFGCNVSGFGCRVSGYRVSGCRVSEFGCRASRKSLTSNAVFLFLPYFILGRSSTCSNFEIFHDLSIHI